MGRAGAIVLALTADDASDEQRQRARAADLDSVPRGLRKIDKIEDIKSKLFSKVEVVAYYYQRCCRCVRRASAGGL